LLEFLANLKTVGSDEERSAALEQYAVLDDG